MSDYVNKLGLEKLNVLHELSYDEQNHVEIKKLPETLSFGKHYFTISVNDGLGKLRLRDSSDISIQFQDSAGNDLWFDITDKFSIDGDVVGYIWLKENLSRTYDSIENGTGTLTITGEFEGVPSDWVGKHNFRITKPISINTEISNDSKLIFNSSSLIQTNTNFTENVLTDKNSNTYKRSYLNISSSRLEAISGQLQFIEVSYREQKSRTSDFTVITKYPVTGTTCTSSFEVSQSFIAGLGPISNIQSIPVPRSIRRNKGVDFRLRYLNSLGEYAQDVSKLDTDIIITGSISSVSGTPLELETSDNLVAPGGALIFGTSTNDGIKIDFKAKGEGKYKEERTLEFTPLSKQGGDVKEEKSFAIAEQGGFVNDIETNEVTQSANASLIGSTQSSITSSANSIILGSISSSIQNSSISTIIGGQSNRIHHSSSINLIGTDIGDGIIGGTNNTISASITSASAIQNSYIFGGTGNTIHRTGSSPLVNATILGGISNTINAGLSNVIVGGFANKAHGDNSAVIGGSGNIAKHIKAVIIGKSSFTSTAANTTYVQNLDVAGNLTVNSITSSIVSSSTIFSSGSNIFGDAIDDTHLFNGHITASGNISASGQLNATELHLVKTGASANEKLLTITEDGNERFYVDEDGDVGFDGTMYGNHIVDLSSLRIGPDDGQGITLSQLSTQGRLAFHQPDDTGNIYFEVSDSNIIVNQNHLDIQSTTDATNDTGDTGALRVEGGVSIAKSVWVGTNLNANNISSSGHITASGNISASGDIYADGIKATLPAGVDNSVVILDADGFLKTDEVDSKIFVTNGLIGVAGGALFGSSTNGNYPFVDDGDNNTLDSGTGLKKVTGGVEVTGDLKISSHITASENISSSGHLIASTSNAAGSPFLTVLVDTGSGQFYYTGSYGGGSSAGGGGTTTNALTAGSGLNNGGGTFNGGTARTFSVDSASMGGFYSASMNNFTTVGTGSFGAVTSTGTISSSKTIFAENFTGGIITDTDSGQFKGWKYRGFYDIGGHLHFGNGFWNLYRSTTKQITGNSTGVHINDLNADVDFRVDGDGYDKIIWSEASSDSLYLVSGSTGNLAIGAGSTGSSKVHIEGDLKTTSHITASGNISSSGTVIGSNLSGTNTGDITLAGTPDYITISNQVITRNTIDIGDDTNLTGGTGITLTGDTLSTTDGEIVHDNLSGFVPNEHIDHSGVTMTAGAGLNGGGTIAATRTFSVDSASMGGFYSASMNNFTTTGTGSFGAVTSTGTISSSGTIIGNAINVNGTDVLVAGGVDISSDTNLTGGTGITLTGDTLSTTDGEIVHDNLSGFVPNEHIDHSGVTMTAGAGLNGGGTIAATRTFSVDSASMGGFYSASMNNFTTTGTGSFGYVTGTEISASQKIIGNTLTLDGLLNQGSETTAVVINDSNVVGTRALGSNAFNSTTIGTTTNALTAGTGLNNGGGTFNGGTARTFSVDSASFAGFYSASMDNFTTTGFIKGNHITASGNISASGNIIGTWAGTAITHDYIGLDAIDGTNIADNAINSEHYTNASIDNEHLADNAVDTDEIADNAVSLAKMAGLARGKIIVGDASGDPSALGAGANGKILVADANGDPSWTSLSGDATLSAGALTIADDSVEGTMLNTNAADTSTIELSSDTLSVLKVPNALTAGTGLNNGGGTFDGAATRTFSVDSASFAGFYSASMNNFTTTGFIKGNHITASGNISASGNLYVDGFISASNNISIIKNNDSRDVSLTIRNSAAGSSTNETATLHFGHGTSGGGKIVSGRDGGYNVGNTASSNMQFHTQTGGIPISVNERMRLTNLGNLGIGITTPTKKLQVEGSISSSGDLHIQGNITASAGNFSSHITASGNISASQKIIGNTLTLDGLSNQGSEATAVMINTSGVVGTRELGSNAFTSTTIGTTTNALTAGTGLNNGGGTFTGATARTFSVDSASFAGFYSGSMNNFTTTGFIKGNHITASGNISASGNNHILNGTITSGDIHLTEVSSPTIQMTDTTNDNKLIIQQGNTLAYIGFDDHADQDLRFDSNADNNHIYLEGSSGNTGFGDNTPKAKVDINGNLQVQSHITASENISSSGTIVGSNLSGTNTGDVTLSGTPNYITISGQTITRNTIDIGDDTNLTGGTGITLTGDTLSTTDSEIVHDNLSGFVPNEHIDHSGVTMTAGAGLNGGGTIAATRTFSVDSASFAGFYSASMNNFTTTGFIKGNHITASGNISSSGVIHGKIGTSDTNVDAAHYPVIQTGQSGIPFISNTFAMNPSSNITTFGGETDIGLHINVGKSSTGHITASGNISASGTITATTGMNVNGTNVLVAGGVDISDDTNLVGGTGITLTGDTLSTTDSEIVHDNLSGFVPNEHIDHSGVTMTAGAGLNGGGTIAATRTFSVDSASMGGFYSASMNNLTTTGNLIGTKLGINVDSPNYEGQIHSTGNTNFQITTATTGTGVSDGLVLGVGSATQDGVLWNFENSDLYFGTNNTEKLRIMNTGRVGIGNTNPPKELTVEGSISASGDLVIGNLSGTYISASGGNLEVNGSGTANLIVDGIISSSTYLALKETGSISGGTDGSSNPYLFASSSGELCYQSGSTAASVIALGTSTGGGGGTITALNNQTVNRLVTIGSTTTELDGEANITYDGTTFTVNDDMKVGDGDDRLTVAGDVSSSVGFMVGHPSNGEKFISASLDKFVVRTNNDNVSAPRLEMKNTTLVSKIDSIRQNAGTNLDLILQSENDGSGNSRVGIVTTSPTKALQVEGDISASGEFFGKLKDIKNSAFYHNSSTNRVWIPLAGTLSDTTSTNGQWYSMMHAPYGGRLVKVLLSNQTTNPGLTTVSFHTGSFNTTSAISDKTKGTQEITVDMVDDTTTLFKFSSSIAIFDAGDRVGITVQRSSTNNNYFTATSVWEYDTTNEGNF